MDYLQLERSRKLRAKKLIALTQVNIKSGAFACAECSSTFMASSPAAAAQKAAFALPALADPRFAHWLSFARTLPNIWIGRQKPLIWIKGAAIPIGAMAAHDPGSERVRAARPSHIDQDQRGVQRPGAWKYKRTHRRRLQAIAGARDAAATPNALRRIRDPVTRQTRSKAFMER
jgi:hypothetical protein